ncbi:hypothetical protein L1887_57250 [Cichorium endivia]|nr:hypothetical protein L1887_57250 [Cichorium endivia]
MSKDACVRACDCAPIGVVRRRTSQRAVHLFSTSAPSPAADGDQARPSRNTPDSVNFALSYLCTVESGSDHSDSLDRNTSTSAAALGRNDRIEKIRGLLDSGAYLLGIFSVREPTHQRQDKR